MTSKYEEIKKAIENGIYALDRAICFKHPSSSQKKIEELALENNKYALQSLRDLKESVDVQELRDAVHDIKVSGCFENLEEYKEGITCWAEQWNPIFNAAQKLLEFLGGENA